MLSVAPPDSPVLFPTPAAWRAWLDEHHAASPGIWLQIAKKKSGVRSVTYAEALDIALCYGWIDGLKKTHDADTFIQRFTPRRPRSIWSKINRDKVLALIEADLVHAAGRAVIERAKQDGTWDCAYDAVSRATVPGDLAAALRNNPAARKFFPKLNAQNRYAILFRLQTARTPETRAKRLDQYVAMLARGQTLHPQTTAAARKTEPRTRRIR